MNRVWTQEEVDEVYRRARERHEVLAALTASDDDNLETWVDLDVEYPR